MIYRNEKGEKLYPVCNWERNQHKIYWYEDKCYNELQDLIYNTAEDFTEEEERYNEACATLKAFDKNVHNDIVYATWQMSCKIKDVIALYNNLARTDF